jgi:hypothetical protein
MAFWYADADADSCNLLLQYLAAYLRHNTPAMHYVSTAAASRLAHAELQLQSHMDNNAHLFSCLGAPPSPMTIVTI